MHADPMAAAAAAGVAPEPTVQIPTDEYRAIEALEAGLRLGVEGLIKLSLQDPYMKQRIGLILEEHINAGTIFSLGNKWAQMANLEDKILKLKTEYDRHQEYLEKQQKDLKDFL